MRNTSRAFEGYTCPIKVTSRRVDLIHSVASQLGEDPNLTSDFITAFIVVYDCIVGNVYEPLRDDSRNPMLSTLREASSNIDDISIWNEKALLSILNQVDIFKGLRRVIESEEDGAYYRAAIEHEFMFPVDSEKILVELRSNGLGFFDISKVVEAIQEFVGIPPEADAEVIKSVVTSNIMTFNADNAKNIIRAKFLAPTDDTVIRGAMLSDIKLDYLQKQLCDDFKRHFIYNIIIELLTIAVYSAAKE